MEIGTYATDTVKIVGSCKFYLVHPDTEKLQEVTFFVARNDGSVLLSCHNYTLHLDLYNQEQDWITYHQEQVLSQAQWIIHKENKMPSSCSQLNNR